MVEQRLRDASYIFALSQLKGVGPHLLLQIVRAFPEPNHLLNASDLEVMERLGHKIPQSLFPSVRDRWSFIWKSAEEAISHHFEEGVSPIPITDDMYPPLLKLIPDPPVILYAKGNASALCRSDAIAIVGTRNPTERGKQVANRIAKYFSNSKYVVVSGLAKGIDTSAHEGTLEAGGITIAVLGTPLDKIYPAENRPLAERIIDNSGVLISELALGKNSNRMGFVRRDRIQSGLSLGVVPVQTDISGGTMHTVKFGEEQKRLLFCPKPIDLEVQQKQYAGILQLIKSGRAKEFQAEDYATLLRMLQENKQRLLSRFDLQDNVVVRDDSRVEIQRKLDLGTKEQISKMRRLQLEYQIENISVLYEEGSVPWPNAEFTSQKGLTANLKIWEDDIEPEQIAKTWKNLDERGESFRIAMKYLGNHSITFKKNDYVTYYFDDQKFTPRNETEIEYLIKYLRGEIASFSVLSMTIPVPRFTGSGHQSPIPLPKIMPFIPHRLHGKAATLIVADQLANYPDLQLKLAYLLLEDFLGKDALKNDKMRCARDFVSHPSCNFRNIVDFINSELPSAKIGKAVRFERDKGDHIAFVSKWANLALQRAKGLFEDEVKSLGGSVGL